MFGSAGLPHGFCFLWNPQLLWLHVVSDSLIALAYLLIPVALVRIVRKRQDLPFNWIFFSFGAFIIACGTTHVMEVVTLWHPVYWLSGSIKAFTAFVSLLTFVLLFRLTPAILALPSHSDLAAANHRLDSVLEHTTLGVFAIDRDWNITYLNGVARARLQTGDPLLGRNLWEALPNQLPATVAALRQAMETRIASEFESYYEPLDLPASISVHPWEDGGITIFFSDLSKQKRLERELELERALRDQRIEALAHMAGGLAHEISNPLGIIHARASDLAETASLGKPIPAQVVGAASDSIINTSDRAIRILRGLRMFAREGSRDPMVPTPVMPLIEQTIELVERRYQAGQISLTVAADPGLPDIACREVQIGQIILNLLNNAFDAIDASPGSRRWVRLHAGSTSASLIIDVIDGGPGVALEHRPHLMEPFFTTKPVGSGMGVGLSLSRAIARDHGGDLQLIDSEGHTCFRLTLPLASPTAPEGSAP